MADPREITELNARIVRQLDGAPGVGEVPVEAVRQAREEGRSVFGPLRRSPRATEERIRTGEGSLPVRIFQPETEVRGVYLHCHGGGWALGAPHHQDPRLERLADATGQVVVSVGYRLSPEDPYPAGPDDCEAVGLAVVESAATRFGTDALTIGGESAGAHLALVTALRLRDRHGFTGFRAANLLYGIFDLRMTPSARRYGRGPQVLTTDSVRWFIEQFAGPADRDDPDLSPLFADLTDMPPAIFTIGTHDPLLDDTLFMHQKWQAAGLEAVIQIFPDAPHAFDAFDVGVATVAHAAINAFLGDHLPGAAPRDRRPRLPRRSIRDARSPWI